jgi:hypothetical protein
MAQFKQWALEYVLSDDEPTQLEITKKAALGEESAARPRDGIYSRSFADLFRNRELPGKQHSGWKLGSVSAAMDDPRQCRR